MTKMSRLQNRKFMPTEGGHFNSIEDAMQAGVPLGVQVSIGKTIYIRKDGGFEKVRDISKDKETEEEPEEDSTLKQPTVKQTPHATAAEKRERTRRLSTPLIY